MSAPSIVVEIRLEEAPRARVIAMRDAALWGLRHRQEAIDALDAAIVAAAGDCQHFVDLAEVEVAA